MYTLEREAIRSGKLGFDHHFYVDKNGVEYPGREITAIAGNELEENETSISVLVDTGVEGELSDAIRFGLRQLINKLQNDYKNELVVIYE